MPTREELIAAVEAKRAKESSISPSGPSREELIKLVEEKRKKESASVQEPGMLEAAGRSILDNVVVPVGRFVDTYTGAPTRKAIGAAQEGKNPITAFAGQIGEDPDLAPTGKQIAQKAGLSGDESSSLSSVVPGLYSPTGDEWLKFKKGGIFDPTPAGAAGLGVDVAADWTNFIPARAVGKAIAEIGTKGAKEAATVGAKSVDLGAQGAAKAADLATGTTVATKSLDAAKDFSSSIIKDTKGAAKKILISDQHPDYGRLLEIAKREGIDPNLLSPSVEFGPHSTISRVNRMLAEGPVGEDMLKAHNAGADAIENAAYKNVSKIAGGAASDAVTGGLAVREGLEQAKKTVLDSDKLTYDSVRKYAPGLTIPKEQWQAFNSEVGAIEKWAKGVEGIKSPNATYRSQAAEVLDAIEKVRATGGKSYKQFNEMRDAIGNIAFKDPKTFAGGIMPNQEKLADMYFSMRNAMLETVKNHVNPAFAEEIAQNNKTISSFLNDIKKVNREMSSPTMSETGLLNTVLSNPKKAEAFVKWASPESANVARSAYMNKFLDGASTQNGISWAGLKKSMDKNAETLGVLFKPEEIKALNDLADLGIAHGPGGLNPSMTSVSMRIRDIASSVPIESTLKKVLKNRIASARAKGINPATVSSSIAKNQSGQVATDFLSVLYDALDKPRVLGKRDSGIAQAGKVAQVASVQSTGENKWAMSGAQKLGIEDPSQIMQSKEGKRLLIEASDLPANSPKLKMILEKLRGINGN